MRSFNNKINYYFKVKTLLIIYYAFFLIFYNPLNYNALQINKYSFLFLIYKLLKLIFNLIPK